jgi:YYY domain-containing protein
MEVVAVSKYLLAFALLAAIGAPVAALVFRDLPRRGGSLAIPTALVPFAVVVFWVGQVTFGLHVVVLALVAVAGASVVAYRRGARPDWRSVLEGYAVFAVGFSVLVVMRSGTPGITPAGGEQFLHFALVNAIERAPSLPPEDVWYAGAPLRYYYGSQLQVTALAMLTGTPLRYGFNLGIASFYGVLFGVAYGLVGSVAARRGLSFRPAGVLGAFTVALAGPTTAAVRLLTPLLPEPISRPVARAAFGFAADRFFDGDLAAAVAELSALRSWEWWFTRYVVPGTIQEVPLYSFVKADLHGHALSTGYVLFAAALAYAYTLTPAEDRLRRAALVVGGLGTVGGVFGFMNTWALPTVGGLALLAVGAADAHPATLIPGRVGDRLRSGTTEPAAAASSAATAWVDAPLRRTVDEGWRLALGGVAGLAVVAVGVAVASPFLLSGQVPSNEGVGLFPPRSPLGPFLVVYGGLLTLFAVGVATRVGSAVTAGNRPIPAAVAVGCLVAATVAALGDELGVLAVTLLLVVAGWLLVRSDRGDFGLVLLVAGVGLVLSLELVHARLPRIDPPRWNTALKVAVQGWTLGAAGAAVVATAVLARWRARLAAYRHSDGLPRAGRPRRSSLARSSLAAGVVVVALLTGGVFPVLVATHEVGPILPPDADDPSLDGYAYLTDVHPEDAAAIDWLDRRRGTPTIVEAPGTPYGFTSPYSTFTGLPTVIGWDHQVEYRSLTAYERRVERVDAIYSREWPDAARNLDRYDVTYVVVGPNEHDRYGADLRGFDRPALSVAYENEAVTIHRVDQSALDGSARTRSPARPGDEWYR